MFEIGCNTYISTRLTCLIQCKCSLKDFNYFFFTYLNLLTVNFGGKLPLTYYNLINEEISRREDNKDREYGSTPGRDGHKVTFLSCDWSDDHYHDAFISFIQDVTLVRSITPGHNQDVPNPNAINRPLAWPIRVKSSISMDMQVNI